MKAFRVGRECDPVALHDQLVQAGVPVVTVRADYHGSGPTAMYAVVVTEDGAPSNTGSLIQAHKATGAPGRKPTAGELEAGLKSLERL